MDKQHILDEIRRTADRNGGKPLGRARFQEATGISQSDWSGRFWVRWSDAIREAGFEPNELRAAFDDDHLLGRLASLVRELGHYPVNAELRMKARQDPDFPSHNTFRRFGRKKQVISALLTWCEANSEWEDVQSICAPLAKEAVVRQDADANGQPDDQVAEFGYVYLLRSGRFYKIGRSNSPGRRAYELSIQLPEPIVTVHVIKTDDPSGIERYWHTRFADKRKNGEWFELSAADVVAFRRRKFM